MSIVRARNVHKVYPTNGAQVHALRGIDLTVEAGEFVAIMGPSGCGKSTLLYLLAGLDVPTEGEIWLVGQPIHQWNESQRARLRRVAAGVVFQSFNLIPHLTVADNVDLPGLLAGRPAREVAQAREALLTRLGLADRARAFPPQLSGGEQQRVALARALINRPQVLFADEPTGSLDTRSAAEVMALLQQYHQEGQTILLVTHDPTIASYADRIIFMRDGRFVSEMRPEPGQAPQAVLGQLLDAF